jgi:4-hydroxy-tetrahydrodipicolinate synthase
LITAIKTPYTSTGRIDLNAYEKIVEFQIANGVDGLIVGGTTGEGHLMNWEEHLTLIEYSVDMFGDKLTIIGNTGSNSTREAVQATKEGFRAGMHGSLQINPYYGKSSP